MLQKSVKNFVDNIEKKLFLSNQEKTDSVTLKLEKVNFSPLHSDLLKIIQN